ncbi:hypothetical protein PUN28_002130 [Cardiocondyla obscurior]|uniref:HECT-type E3 ubiquitin transferase n=1 Tax=Cardiocondyla obscurior TaxID=286306 RepID=A0AAW2GSU4_9HYME
MKNTKLIYIGLVCQMQSNAFLEGLCDIIRRRLISVFNEQEQLINGVSNINTDYLKENTDYHKQTATSLQFLQFVSDIPSVGLQGFSALEGMNSV